jgi:hypothetical protein
MTTLLQFVVALCEVLFAPHKGNDLLLSNRSGYRALSALAMSAKADVLPTARTRKVRAPKTRKLVIRSLQWKAENKARKAAMGRKAHMERCEALYEARKARSAAMEWHTVANEEAAALKAAVVFMTGKSWQQALGAMYAQGRLVSSGSGSVAAPATARVRVAKAVKGNIFITAPSKVEGVHAKDTAFCASHVVVRTKGVPVLCTWNNYRKVVPIGRVMLLMQRREAAAEKANRVAIQALERHLKIAAWEAVQAAKVAA